MYAEDNEKKCSLCFYSAQAKGLSDKLYCDRRKEYRSLWADVCGDYLYDITKRPMRRRRKMQTPIDIYFEI